MLGQLKVVFSLSGLLPRQNIASIASQHVDTFRSILGDKFVIDEGHPELSSMNFEFTKNRHGKAKIALLPSDEVQISKILAYCNKNG